MMTLLTASKKVITQHYAFLLRSLYSLHAKCNFFAASTKNMLGPLLTVFPAFIFAYAADLSAEYAHHAVLDPKGLMKLYWTVHWDTESVSFAVEAATTGWIGFGFSSGNGKMVGSDMVMGYVKESKGYLTVKMTGLFRSKSYLDTLSIYYIYPDTTCSNKYTRACFEGIVLRDRY